MIWHLLNPPEQKAKIPHLFFFLNNESPVVVPAWPEFRQRWLTPAADALLQCYGSMPFHQTAGPCPVCANLDAAAEDSNTIIMCKTYMFLSTCIMNYYTIKDYSLVDPPPVFGQQRWSVHLLILEFPAES